MFCCLALHRLFCYAILLLASAPSFSLAQDAGLYRSGAMLVNTMVLLKQTIHIIPLYYYVSSPYFSYHYHRRCANQSRSCYNRCSRTHFEVSDAVKLPTLYLGMVRLALHSLSSPLDCPQSAVDKSGPTQAEQPGSPHVYTRHTGKGHGRGGVMIVDMIWNLCGLGFGRLIRFFYAGYVGH